MFILKQEIIMPLAMVTRFCLMFAKSWIQLFGHCWQKMKARMIKSCQSNLLQSTIFLKDSRPCLFLNPSLAIPNKLTFVDVVWHAYHYFDIKNIKPVSLWSKICTLGKDRESWHDIMILIKLCLCTPFSNATLERFFSHLKVVKTELRSRLSSESLDSLMRIRMKGLSIANFDKDYLSQCVSHLYGSKAHQIGQKKRKKYEAWKTKKKQQPNLKNWWLGQWFFLCFLKWWRMIL